jgi:hypothetical protein
VWVGPEFESADIKLLVLGESRYDEDFSDRKIIESQIAGDLPGRQRRTFTNFELAALGQEHSEPDARAFWRKTAFYNYNRSFFPGGPRVRQSYRTRDNKQNVSSLRRVLQELRPTHVIVWGKTNWDSIDAGSQWTLDAPLAGTQEIYCSTMIDGHTTLFTYVHHPSAGFSSRYWAPVLSQFLKLQTLAEHVSLRSCAANSDA